MTKTQEWTDPPELTAAQLRELNWLYNSDADQPRAQHGSAMVALEKKKCVVRRRGVWMITGTGCLTVMYWNKRA